MNYQSVIIKHEHKHISKIIKNRPNDLNTFNDSLAFKLNHSLHELN